MRTSPFHWGKGHCLYILLQCNEDVHRLGFLGDDLTDSNCKLDCCVEQTLVTRVEVARFSLCAGDLLSICPGVIQTVY